MKVLITGAGGFIGSQVVRKVLQEGHAVVAVLRPGESRERLSDCLDSISLFRCDLNAVSIPKAAEGEETYV